MQTMHLKPEEQDPESSNWLDYKQKLLRKKQTYLEVGGLIFGCVSLYFMFASVYENIELLIYIQSKTEEGSFYEWNHFRQQSVCRRTHVLYR